MILDLLWMALANAASVFGALALLGRAGTRSGPVNLLILLLARLAIVSAAVIVAGVGGFLTPAGLGIPAAVALAALLASGIHRRPRPPLEWPEIGLGVGFLAVLLLARLLAQAWFFAPYPGDVLGYHLPKVAEWIRSGAFTRQMGADTHSTFPAGFEVIETWWVVFLRHDVFIEMAGIEFLAVAASAAYALARRLGLPERASAGAALAFVLTPGLHLQATAAVNDAPVAALVTAAFALAAWRAPLEMILLPAGLGLGVKPSFAYALPGVALLSFLIRREPALETGPRRVGMALASIALVAGAFWYARNTLWYGNPIHPVGLGGLSGPHPIQFGGRLDSLRGNLMDLVQSRIHDSAGPYSPYLPGLAGWGPVAFACGLPGLLLAARQDPCFRKAVGGYLVSLATVLLLVLHDPWSMRFVLFFPAILSVAAAWLASQGRAATAVMGLALVLQFAGTSLPGEISLENLHALARQPWRERSLGPLLGIHPPEGDVAFFGTRRDPVYVLYGPDFSRRVVYLRCESARELIGEMEREGVRFLYPAPATPGQEDVLAEARQQGWLKPMGGPFYERRSP